MKTRKEIMEELVNEKAKGVVLEQKEEVASKACDSDFYKALADKDIHALKGMQDNIVADYQKAGTNQNIGTPADGGYLVPTTLNDKIIEKLTYLSPIRQIATVISNMPAKLSLPSEESMVKAYWVKEGQAPTASKEQFGSVDLVPEKLGAHVTISYEALMDTATNPSLQDFVAERVAKAIALEENGAFTNGDGQGKPFGFRSSKITPKTGAVAQQGTLTYADIVKAVYGVNAGARKKAVFAVSSETLAKIVGMTDANGAPIFVAPVAQNAPATLLGYPIAEIAEIPTDELWFGDFSNYIIGDRGAIRMTFGTTGTDLENDMVSLVAFKRVAGVPTVGDAFYKLTGIDPA